MYDGKLLRKTVSYGWASAMQQATVQLGKIAVQAIVNTMGVNAMAAFTAASRIDDFAYTPQQNIGHAMTTLMAQNRGAGKTDRVRQGYHCGMRIEFAYGIPGTVGGAVYMNAGAYGGEMKDVLVRCTHIDGDGKLGQLAGEDLHLSYRHSAYYDNGCIITGLELRLQPGDPAEIKAKMDDLISRRREKQPIEYPSAGSTFKRPPGHFAGALIDQCGLRGTSVGGARVSEKHAGFVINTGGATCADVLALCRQCREKVLAETGVELEMEIRVTE